MGWLAWEKVFLLLLVVHGYTVVEGKVRNGACIRSYGLGLGFEGHSGRIGRRRRQGNDALSSLHLYGLRYFPLDFWCDTFSRGLGLFFFRFFFPRFPSPVWFSFFRPFVFSLYSTQDTAGAATDRLICWSFVVEGTKWYQFGYFREGVRWGIVVVSFLLFASSRAALLCVCMIWVFPFLGIGLMGGDSDYRSFSLFFPIYFYFFFFSFHSPLHFLPPELLKNLPSRIVVTLPLLTV